MVDAQTLGPLEVRVLALLRSGEPTAVAALRDQLERDGSELAYTTVMTVLSRLHKKGLLKRKREGNRYLYSPAASAPRVLGGILTRVRRALSASDGDRAAPILTLLEQEEFSADELRALRRAIDDKLKEQKR
jgi:predicted transcriptional regulator